MQTVSACIGGMGLLPPRMLMDSSQPSESSDLEAGFKIVKGCGTLRAVAPLGMKLLVHKMVRTDEWECFCRVRS